MNFNSTTASFTVSAELWALLSMANLPTDSAFHDVSVRRLTVLLQASFPQNLAAPQLPFANSFCTFKKQYRSSPIGDLHPISSCPCRAYQGIQPIESAVLFSKFCGVFKVYFNFIAAFNAVSTADAGVETVEKGLYLENHAKSC